MKYLIIFLAFIGFISALFVLIFYKCMDFIESEKPIETKAKQNGKSITFEEHNI